MLIEVNRQFACCTSCTIVLRVKALELQLSYVLVCAQCLKNSGEGDILC